MSIKAQRRAKQLARRNLTDAERLDASRIICKRVIESREFRSCKMIACYLPMQNEVDTREIIERAWRANKRVFVPVLRDNAQMVFCEITAETELQRNSFGTWEPTRGILIDPQMLNLVVTPTVAFDKNNNRIGMGSGYYDRHFAFLRHRKFWIRPKLLGVAFQCQEVEKITPNAWDIPLYRVVTEKE